MFDSRVSDFSSLATCPLLERIDAGKTHVTSLGAFAGLTGLTFLKVTFAPLDTLEGIGAFAGLERLELGGVRDRNLTSLLSLPQLIEVSLSEDLRQEAERDLANASFQISFS